MTVSTKTLEQIKSLKVSHPKWNLAYKEASNMMLIAQPGEVVGIVGASRIGKTRLVNELRSTIFTSPSTGSFSTVYCLAENCSTSGEFSTKAFTQRLLDAIEHPFFATRNIVDVDCAASIVRMSRLSEGVMRSALEKALIHRKTRYLFIDEAQHVLYAKKGAKGAGAILDSWKSLAQICQLVLVLVGAYPLLNALNHSPHMVGRTLNVHFPRYHLNTKDIRDFAGIIRAYLEILKPEKSFDIGEWTEFLFEGSLGSTGLLESWFRRAFARMRVEEKNKLTKDILLKTRKTQKELEIILTEIAQGEEVLSTNPPRKKTGIAAKGNVKHNRKAFQRSPRRLQINN